MIVPSAQVVREVLAEITGVPTGDDRVCRMTFNALGLDAFGRLEFGARLARICEMQTPLDVLDDGSATACELISALIAEQLDSDTQPHQGG